MNISSKMENLLGRKFGWLTVREYIGRVGRRRHSWRCRCKCGNFTTCCSDNLKQGKVKSCGCLRRLSAKEQSTKHGLSSSSEYWIYRTMKSRTLNPKDISYKRYGALGVRVCDRWIAGDGKRTGFECFYKDMGPRPSSGHSLDRYPNGAGNYEPGNVRWATRKEQQNNMKSNKLLTWEGETLTIKQWSEKTGITSSALYQRAAKGWSTVKILTTPLKSCR